MESCDNQKNQGRRATAPALRRTVGRNREEEVKASLIGNGWVHLASNYYWRGGEIDLIFEEATSGRIELVFIEVRSLIDGPESRLLESITWVKRARIEATARHFLVHYRGKAGSIRFDLWIHTGTDWKSFENAWQSNY